MTASEPDALALLERRVLVRMPSAKDTERTRRFLAEGGIPSAPCGSLHEVCAEIRRGVGAILLTEEVLLGDERGVLRQCLREQPTWSALPLVVVARDAREGEPEQEGVFERLFDSSASHATLVERPVRARSLLSIVRGALRTRAHQYQIRDALEEQQRERRLYETILEATPDLVYVFDRSHRFTFANRALLEVWGKTKAEAAGKTLLEVGYEPWHAAMHEREIADVIAQKKIIRGEVPFNGANGRRIYDYIFVPVVGGDGEVELVAGTTRDVTEIKEFQTTLARQADQLRDTDRRKDEFLATLAHELRNPLAPIAAGLQVQKLDPHGEAASRAREMMDRQLTHMVRLIDDLLDVSRITRGKVELKPERTTLQKVVAAGIEASEPFVRAGLHRLDVDLPRVPIALHVDPTRLAQVVSNLVNNAAKYTPVAGWIQVRARQEGETAIMEVEDDGAGIPAEKLNEVFEMFSQVNRTLDRAQGGLGIGLALVRKLLEMHGGTIAVRSPGAGLGSTFTVRLPAVTADVGDEPRHGEPMLPKGTGKRVLIVDDNVDAAEFLSILLDIAGHQTRVAHSGAEALDAAPEFGPEAVFLDIGLPGMNGYDVARAFRRDERLRAAMLVALTGWGAEDDKRKAKEAGFDHHLTKPVDSTAVEALLSKAPPARW